MLCLFITVVEAIMRLEAFVVKALGLSFCIAESVRHGSFFERDR